MARKTSTVPTRIWSFGCHAPSPEAQVLVKEQVFKAHRYYNRLIEIDRERRTKYREARLRYFPQLAALEEQATAIGAALEAARGELKTQRQTDRKRSEPSPELKSRIAGLVLSVREVRTKLKAERGEVTTQTKQAQGHLAEMADTKTSAERLEALKYLLPHTPQVILEFAVESTKVQDDSYQAVRDARAACEVYWGTYLLIEEAAKAACQAPIDPRFKSFDGSGRIGVQIQAGLSTGDLFGAKSTFLQIDPLPANQWATRSGCRHAWTKVRIRMGSNPDRTPLWVEFPVVIHRKLPEGVIKRAWIQVRKSGARIYYRLQIMIEAVAFIQRARGSEGSVALDVGWRSLPNGNLRVAYWVDDRGRQGSLELPQRLRTGMDVPDRLQSFSDLHFEAAKKVLQAWLAKQTDLPEWLKEEASHLGQWRQPRRLARLAHRFTTELSPPGFAFDLWKRWKEQRLAALPKLDLLAPFTEVSNWVGLSNDETVRVAVYLEFWRQKNKHLLDWSSNQRDKTLGHRKDIYLQWSKWLVETYNVIVLEDFDLRKVSRHAAPEGEDDFARAVRHNRKVAAVSELRRAIVERAVPEAIVRLPAMDTTITCNPCGHVEDFDRQKELVHTCPNCGKTWDQDRNAAKNLLDALNSSGEPARREPEGETQTPGTARKKAKKASSLKNATALPSSTPRG